MPNVKLALSYYAERPRGLRADEKKGITYPEEKLDFEQKLYSLLDDMSVPRTVFVLGDYLKGCANLLPNLNLKDIYSTSKNSDIQSHGKAHIILKKKSFEETEPVTTQIFLDDLSDANDIIQEILGVTPTGAGFPYGFDTDLSDNTELLTGLSKIGFKYISSDTSGKDTLEATLSSERQPHTYRESGFPDLVQIPTSGLQDVILTEEKRKLFGFNSLRTQEEISRYYNNLVLKAKYFDIPRVYVSFCLHPWAVMEYDPQLKITKSIVNTARENGVDIVSFSQIADEVLKRET